MKYKKRNKNKSFLGLMLLIIMLVFINIEGQSNNLNTEETLNSEKAKNEELLNVYFFDVGQGDSIYIKTPAGDDILIDAGENAYGDDVVKYLNELEVDDLEVLIATHPHSDHIGGLDTVLANFKVESVYAPKVVHTTKSYEDFINAVNNEGLSIVNVKDGIKLPLKGVDAIFVGPINEYDDLNNYSAVLRLTYKNNTFLFTGDAEKESEIDIINSGQSIDADVLKIGHHGSVSSCSEQFLKEVQPTYGVISIGINNDYGHPHKETIDKLNNNGIVVYRTDLLGTIVATSDGKNINFLIDRK